MNKKYLIHLKPLGNFYFGGERSFREHKPDETKKEAARQAKNESLSYIVESNYYPQQTALLGMLRFLLLRNSGSDVFENNKIKDYEKAANLIGSSSFMLCEEECLFGMIKKIGTCFISNGSEVLLPMPLDYELDVDFNNASTARYGSRKITLPQVYYNNKPYTAKESISEKLLLREEIINYDYDKDTQKGVFVKDRRVGINRDITSGKVAENSLYKQEFYRMSDGYEFVFEAEFDEGFESEAYTNQIVTLGGDNSQFSIAFEERSINPQCTGVKMSEGMYKAILISDALIDDTLSCFSVSVNTPMRFMVTDVKPTENYSKIKKSDRRSLYKKGSVFYFNSENDREAFIKTVEADINFKNIGYNNIKTID